MLTLYDSNLQRAKRNTIGYSHIQVEPFYPIIIRLIVAVPKPTINIIYLQRHISLIKFDIQNTYAERIATTEIEKELIKNLYRNPKRYSTAGWNSGLTDTRIWKAQVHQCGHRG